ncbi:MAG: DUF3179 domain-containing protein [Candidatus Thiodiazotropha sp. (ex Epidulcina cf. delphinae)]|nr:DUF3179 domain-containing protein [Candidatus Thiodiazotropha sp. (ex Epidulcina cf. delphinae)]
MRYCVPRFFIVLLLTGWLTGSAQAGPSKNGFDLSDALIPVESVLSGGPPRDGIPAIDKPRFLSAAKADFLAADDRILGLAHNGVTKAYPIAIMDWHEIVNDRFGGEGVAITYCPLCGTGIAFLAQVDGARLTFGVSGLLYNSDVLLYDRRTDSLWSQIKMQAVSGAYKGRRLTPLPLQHTTWSDWRQRHPRTLVLSQKTGYSRNYQRSPYQGYETSRQVYFPVEFLSQGYHPKERVLGLEIDGRVKAYPFVELSKTSGLVKDRLAGKAIEIHYDADNQTATAIDATGRMMPSVTAFWFAWYAFHPDTALFKVE